MTSVLVFDPVAISTGVVGEYLVSVWAVVLMDVPDGQLMWRVYDIRQSLN